MTNANETFDNAIIGYARECAASDVERGKASREEAREHAVASCQEGLTDSEAEAFVDAYLEAAEELADEGEDDNDEGIVHRFLITGAESLAACLDFMLLDKHIRLDDDVIEHVIRTHFSGDYKDIAGEQVEELFQTCVKRARSLNSMYESVLSTAVEHSQDTGKAVCVEVPDPNEGMVALMRRHRTLGENVDAIDRGNGLEVWCENPDDAARDTWRVRLTRVEDPER